MATINSTPWSCCAVSRQSGRAWTAWRGRSPDGKSLYVMCGNQLPEPSCETSRVPRNWAEDQLFPMLLGRGFMRDVLAPGGWLAKTDLDGKKWELINTGTRNTYDIAINRKGDIFGFDADMEWDTGMPWYRPTRVCFMQSGGEFGWRTCSKKWPVRWEDSLPAVVDIGPGSPTGVAFGYGAKFPAKYPRRPLHLRLELRQNVRRASRSKRRRLHRRRRKNS
jgi:hypothetical protein